MNRIEGDVIFSYSVQINNRNIYKLMYCNPPSRQDACPILRSRNAALHPDLNNRKLAAVRSWTLPVCTSIVSIKKKLGKILSRRLDLGIKTAGFVRADP